MTKLERLKSDMTVAFTDYMDNPNDEHFINLAVDAREAYKKELKRIEGAINARDDAKVITNAAWAEYQDELKRVENENT